MYASNLPSFLYFNKYPSIQIFLRPSFLLNLVCPNVPIVVKLA